MQVCKKISITKVQYAIVDVSNGQAENFEIVLTGRPSVNKTMKEISATLNDKNRVVNIQKVETKKVLYAMDLNKFIELAERIGECE